MRWIIFILITSLVLIGLSVIIIIGEERNYNNKIYPNVYINEVDFGRRSKTEVLAYFNNLNRQFEKVRIDVLYQDEPTATFSGEQLKIGYDATGIADRVYLIGRSPFFTSRLYQKLATILSWQNFKFVVNIYYDKLPVQEYIASAKEKYDKPAKNALFSFENGRVVSFRQEEKGQEID